jgi:tetratricopeptide (TPR) repeat protein
MSFGKIMERMKRFPGRNKKPDISDPEEFKAVCSRSEERPFKMDKSYKIELFKIVEAMKDAWTLIEIYKDTKTKDNALRLIRDLKDVLDETIEKKLEKNKNFYDAIKAFDKALKQLESAEEYFNNPPKFDTSPELVEQCEDENNFMLVFNMYKNTWAEKISHSLNEHGRKETYDKQEEHDKDRELIDRIIRIQAVRENKPDKSESNLSEIELILEEPLLVRSNPGYQAY